jgi:hypothetical protein
MRYQDCVELAQAEIWSDDDAWPGRNDANVNPMTGLATDYLNHFIEAVMLLELMPSCPDCRRDFLDWRPMSYREHFAASRFATRDMAIAAYEAADPNLRGCLDALAGTMTAMLEATRTALVSEMPAEAAAALAGRVVASLKPLIVRAGAVINGEGAAWYPVGQQSVVDGLMKQ